MEIKTLTIFYLACLTKQQQVLAKLNMDFAPPNIVIIMTDDMGLDDVSFRGNNEFLTPNIDALAYHGKVLNRLYTPTLCTPSRATLLTGLYPIHTGSQHLVLFNQEPWGMLENQTSMAKIFQANGYSTNMLGKWHLGMGRKEFTPTYNGFDYHYGYWGAYIDYYSKSARIPGSPSFGYDFRRNQDIECSSNTSYFTDLLTNEAERIISDNAGRKPLFLYVSHLSVHTANDEDPLQAPEEEIAKFAYIPDVNRRTYAAMVSKLDENFGRIVKALDKAEMLNNTIIVFLSDNGAPSVGMFNNTGSNWPLRGQKHSPWDGGIRVAGVVWSPLLKNRASIYQQPMYSGDLLPSLAAAAKINLKPLRLKLDGINIWPDLVASKSNTPPGKHADRQILHVLDDILEVSSYMKGQYKYIKGTTLEGQYDYVVAQRNLSNIDPRAQNYVEIIRSSLASTVLRKYDTETLTPRKIETLRSQLAIECGQMSFPCNPLQEECLFNIWLDPCEQMNLAKNPKFAHVLKKMRREVEALRATAVQPKTGGEDLDYDPSRHNCLWTKYLEEEPSQDVLNCDNVARPCQGFCTKNDLVEV